MIHSFITGAWGTNEFLDGAQINVKPDENHLFSLQFNGESHAKLVEELIGLLPPEKKRELIPLLTNGIEVPKNFEIGPQG